MEPDALLDEWTTDEPGVRPARVQQLRDDLQRHTDLSIPRRIPVIEEWLDAHRDDVTAQLEAAVDDSS